MLPKPYYSTNLGTLYHGDCLTIMPGLEPVDLVLTSPPYDDLRTYGGFSFDYKNTITSLYRIVKTGGVIVWVVGDATKNGNESGTSFNQALFFKESGFNLHDIMVWIKDGGGAIGSNKTYTQNFEYMFVFSKGDIKTFNLIHDKPNQSYGQDKSGVGRRKKTGEHKIETRKPSKKFSKRNNYWYVPPQRGDHPAVFPDQLAHDHIISWSDKNDIVLDIMCGSGTTCAESEKLNRRWIGIEIEEKYCEIAAKRIENERSQLKLW